MIQAVFLTLAFFVQDQGNCESVGATELSAAQVKARLVHMTPISPPGSVRLTNVVLKFRITTDGKGVVTCVHSLSGHPLLTTSALESIKSWKFRTANQAMVGTLILLLSATKDGLRTTVQSGTPILSR